MNRKIWYTNFLFGIVLVLPFFIMGGCSSNPGQAGSLLKIEKAGFSGKSLALRTVALAPSGKYAAHGKDNSVELIDPLSSKVLRKLTFKKSEIVLSLAFSPVNPHLAIGTYQKFYIWDMQKKSVVKIVFAHNDGVKQLTFNNQGSILASASKGADREIKFWETEQWKHVRSFDARGAFKYVNTVQAMEFSQDDIYFASTGLDKKIRVWSVETGKPVSKIENISKVHSLAFAVDSRILASGDDDGRVKLWNIQDGSNIRTVQADSSPITSISFNKEGGNLASASTKSRVLRLWNTSSWNFERETLVAASVERIVFDNVTLAAVAFNSAGAVSLYQLTGKELSIRPLSTQGGIAPIISIIEPLTLSEVETDNVQLSGLVKGAAKIEKIEIYVNGSLIPDTTRDLSVVPADDKTLPFSFFVALTKEGKNEIKVLARAAGGRQSKEVIHVTKNSEKGQVWGAVIGVSEYRDPSINDLKYAASDAQAFYDYLRDDFAIPEKNLFALYDDKATIQNIRNLLGVKLKNKARKKDTVIIFYAGHGAPEVDSFVEYEDGVEKYFLPHDSDPNSLYSTAFPMKEVEKIVGRIKAERIAFIADTCFSGASDIKPGRTIVTSKRTRSLSTKEYFNWAAKGKGRVVLTASDANERSIEDDTLKHGLFTYYLLEALRGAADTDRDGLVTVDEAYRYTSIKVGMHQTRNKTQPEKEMYADK
ncbi:MAG: caspase family protein [Nitrospinota bacterium]